MKKILFISLIFTAMFAVLTTSCKKEAKPDKDTQSVTDYTKSTESFQSDFNVVNDYGINEEGIKNLMQDTIICTVTPTGLTWPKTLTIDFGANGVLCHDGMYRKGILIAVFSNRWHWISDSLNIGTIVDISFNNYYVKDYSSQSWVKREGNLKITYNGRNTEGGPTYTHQAINAKLIFADGTSLLWNSTHHSSWIAGFSTFTPTDDIVHVDGNDNGVNRRGEAYTVNIPDANPLRFDRTCTPYGDITKGTYTLTPEGLAARNVDFGNGTCDRIATCTVNGITIQFNF